MDLKIDSSLLTHRMLMTEYNQLQDDDQQPSSSTVPAKTLNSNDAKSKEFQKVVRSPIKASSAVASSKATPTPPQQVTTAVDEPKSSGDDDLLLSSPLYENVINSLERRQRERNGQSKTQPVNGRGDSLDSLDDYNNDRHRKMDAEEIDAATVTGTIPAHLLEEAEAIGLRRWISCATESNSGILARRARMSAGPLSCCRLPKEKSIDSRAPPRTVCRACSI